MPITTSSRHHSSSTSSMHHIRPSESYSEETDSISSGSYDNDYDYDASTSGREDGGSVKVEYYSSLPISSSSSSNFQKTTFKTRVKKAVKTPSDWKNAEYKYSTTATATTDRGDYGYKNVKSFYTGVTDLIYVPTERDHWEVAKYARKLKTLPSNASISARYTAGLLSRSADVILTPGAYVLAPGLAGCPDVVFEICPKAGVISIGSGKRVFFEFLNDEDVVVRFELERNPSNGMTFAENLVEKLWKNHFFWASEPVVVTAHLGNFLAASGDMTNEITGPFSSAIFYGAAEHGGPSSVVSRMAPCLGYFSEWESYCKTCVYCPFDVMMAVRMHELKSQVSFFDE